MGPECAKRLRDENIRVTPVDRSNHHHFQPLLVNAAPKVRRAPAERAMVASMPLFLVYFSSLSFLGFGSACLVASYMKREFARYGLERFRVMTGTLQLLGAIGLLAGLQMPWIGRLAAAGLAVLMMLGVGVRLKIKDTPRKIFPAFFYMVLNACLSLSPVWIR